jgi:hypothetical protein
MIAWTVGWRDQKEQDIDVFAVETGKIDALLREGDRRNQPVDGRVFGMGDGDPHSDAGRAKLFTLQDRRDDALLVLGADGAAFPEALHQGPNRALFGRGLQFGQDCLFDHEVSHLH